MIDWVMRAEGVSFRCAVEMLRGDLPSFAALSPKKSGKPKLAAATRSTTVKLPPVLGESADDEALLKQVADYYHATLKESPEALSYLQGRGLQNAEMVEHFRIGFANRAVYVYVVLPAGIWRRCVCGRLHRDNGRIVTEALVQCHDLPMPGLDSGC